MSWKRDSKDSLDNVRIVWEAHELLARDNRRHGNLERARWHEGRVRALREGMQALADAYRSLSRLLP